MRVLYVILHFKDAKLTVECLNSLIHSNVAAGDKVIIVDASHDLNKLDVRFADFIDCFRPREYNPGFARSMNQAVKHEYNSDKFDVLVFLNNDTVLPSNFRKRVIETFKAFPCAGAVGPKIVFYDHPDIVWSAGGKISSLKMASSEYKIYRASSEFHGHEKVEFLSGCVIAIRGEAFQKVGGWPEVYLFGGEEWEMSLLLRRNGYCLVVDHDNVVKHRASYYEGSGSSHSFEDVRFVINGYINRLIFAFRNFSRIKFWTFRLILVLYILFILPWRWLQLGPYFRITQKFSMALRMARVILRRDPSQRVTWQELEILNKEILGHG